MNNTIAITEETVPVVAALAQEIWPDAEPGEHAAHFAELLRRGQGVCYLLQVDGRWAGFVELSVRRDHVEGAEVLPVAYLEGIYLRAEFRGRGFGRALLQVAEDWAVAQGFRQLCSDTELENVEGIRFHERAGFREVERVVCWEKRLEARG